MNFLAPHMPQAAGGNWEAGCELKYKNVRKFNSHKSRILIERNSKFVSMFWVGITSPRVSS
jgi:hypothetical protein